MYIFVKIESFFVGKENENKNEGPSRFERVMLRAELYCEDGSLRKHTS